MTTAHPKVTVIGTTSWGTTLAVVLARKGIDVSLWARTPEEAFLLTVDQENKRHLPGTPFPASLSVTADLTEALDAAQLVIFGVPSQHMRANVKLIAPYIAPGTLVMSAAKGLELGTLLRMSQVLREELPPELHPMCCVLSGPNIAKEIAAGLPAATVIAADTLDVAKAAQNLVMSSRFRVYSTTDMVGVELGGTLKNIVAMGAGMNDGWEYGANTKAAFMTRGLAEITRLGIAAGANPFTFLGLAGLGDLVTTCTSQYSRNRRLGEELARGRKLDDILPTLGGIAEGVTTTLAARELGERLNIDMPITEQAYQVLYCGADPKRAILELMTREPKSEMDGLG